MSTPGLSPRAAAPAPAVVPRAPEGTRLASFGLEGDAGAAHDELHVQVAPPGPVQRGRLRLWIEGAIEDELCRQGAVPPGVTASSDLDASLSDQLYRARLIERPRLHLEIDSLQGIANLSGALDAEDSAVLRWWLAATLERPVRLAFHPSNRWLGVYGPPVTFGALLETQRASLAPAAVPAAPPEVPERAAPASLGTGERPSAKRAMAALFDDEDFEELRECLEVARVDLTTPPPPLVAEAEPAGAPDDGPGDLAAPALDADAGLPGDWATEALRALDAGEPTGDALDARAPAGDALDAGEPTGDALDARELEAREPAPASAPLAFEAQELEPAPSALRLVEPPAPPVSPLFPTATQDWQRWQLELDAARGPKPLAVIERLFTSAYVPLRDAVARGIAPASATPVLDAWAKSFDKSYSDVFEALCHRGKRPQMTLDVPELAQRLGRLHGARSVQLVLVDGLRFDLGLRLQERLRARLAEQAALAERLLLWSALPTHTSAQLELIGRGVAALKERSSGADAEVVVARGRTAQTLRRVKAGFRELMKLDLVEADLAAPGPAEAVRLDELAEDVADALGGYLTTLPPRTLAFVFGDHGFLLEPQGSGTAPARQGGASPEEVLVPAFAWLTGSMQ